MPRLPTVSCCLCQARARSDVTIETREITTPTHARVMRLPARIERAVPLSHDVMGLASAAAR